MFVAYDIIFNSNVPYIITINYWSSIELPIHLFGSKFSRILILSVGACRWTERCLYICYARVFAQLNMCTNVRFVKVIVLRFWHCLHMITFQPHMAINKLSHLKKKALHLNLMRCIHLCDIGSKVMSKLMTNLNKTIEVS